jgi:hypothetical protein
LEDRFPEYDLTKTEQRAFNRVGETIFKKLGQPHSGATGRRLRKAA